MQDTYKIGIDIGGTHTDAVLIDPKGKIIVWNKVTTTIPLEHGFKKVLTKLLQQANIPPECIAEISIGTTHALNALIERRGLNTVGLIRLAGHQPMTLPPCFDWPPDLRQQVLAGWMQVHGGYECDGRTLTPLNLQEVENAAESLLNAGAASLVINGVFSPLYPEQELMAAEFLQNKFGPSLPITLGHHLGGTGFIERENAALLNAALYSVIVQGFSRLKLICEELKLHCPMHLTQNNGSRISLEQALLFPVLTLSAGATNSFIGAAKIAGCEEAIIVDIGGTSTDIGLVQRGFPIRQIGNTDLQGVKLNFPMPNVTSITLGGGTLLHKDPSSLIQLASTSCGRRLETEACAFGGSSLTLTDAALIYGACAIPHAHLKTIPCSHQEAEKALKLALEKIMISIKKVQGKHRHLPIILVGGGAGLLPRSWLDTRFIVPEHACIANAYGAALAEITATVDVTVNMHDRNEVLEKLQVDVIGKLAAAGGDESLARIVDKQILPYHYMPGHQARIILTAASPPKMRCA